LKRLKHNVHPRGHGLPVWRTAEPAATSSWWRRGGGGAVHAVAVTSEHGVGPGGGWLQRRAAVGRRGEGWPRQRGRLGQRGADGVTFGKMAAAAM